MSEPAEATETETDLIGELGTVLRLAGGRGLDLRQLVTCLAVALGELLADAGERDASPALAAAAATAKFAHAQEIARQAEHAASLRQAADS